MYFITFFLLLVLCCSSATNANYNVTDFQTNRIIGGTPAPVGLVPYMVALVLGRVVSNILCGGSLLTTRHVLTAAHCVDAVSVGSDTLSTLRGVVGTNTWVSGGTSYNFVNFTYHPQYNWHMIKNDIAVLVTDRSVALGDNVALVSLRESWIETEDCFFTGWGYVDPIIDDEVVDLMPLPEYLQMLEVRSIRPIDCIVDVNNASLIWGISPPVDYYVEICTLHSKGHGACMGDSGSPLILSKTGEQIGLVSWGYACALGAPDMHVRISGVIEFIRSVIKR